MTRPTKSYLDEIRKLNQDALQSDSAWTADIVSTLFEEIDALRAQLAVAVKALRFYAAGDAGHRTLGRREFGCGCCAGVVMGSAEDPDLDFGRDVIGLTAREALEEIERLG